MNPEDKSLHNWLIAARDELARRDAPAWIEQVIANRVEERRIAAQIAALRSSAAPGKRVRPWLWLGIPAGVFAALVLVVTVLLPETAPPETGARESAFLALAPLESIAAEARPLLVESQLPRAQLAVYGLPVDPTRADVPVRTEFLVSRNGRLLAVRFVQ